MCFLHFYKTNNVVHGKNAWLQLMWMLVELGSLGVKALNHRGCAGIVRGCLLADPGSQIARPKVTLVVLFCLCIWCCDCCWRAFLSLATQNWFSKWNASQKKCLVNNFNNNLWSYHGTSSPLTLICPWDLEEIISLVLIIRS